MSHSVVDTRQAPVVEACWCGCARLAPAAHPGYRVCQACATATLWSEPAAGQEPVREEHAHRYGAAYWNEHQDQLGLSRIAERARTDLAAKVPHWLGRLFKYSLPAGRALEIGCAHGGLVKFLELAGYEALGIEMSPEVIRQAQAWFAVQVLQGPLECLTEPIGLFDLIVLFDVIEHIADPKTFLNTIAAHLAPAGVVAIQTPCHDQTTGAAWPMYVVPEHVVLFSRKGIAALLGEVGLNHVKFEQQKLNQHNMLLFASREPLRENSAEHIADVLLQTPSGRVVQSVIDMESYYEAMQEALQISYINRMRDLRELSPARSYGTRNLARWLIQSTMVSLGRLFRRHH